MTNNTTNFTSQVIKKNPLKHVLPLLLVSIITIIAGCGGGGGKDPILGTGVTGPVLPVPPVPPVTIAPTVISTVPTNGNLAVATNSKVTALFSKSMQPSSIDNTTFLLEGPGAVPVVGMVSYDVSSNTAIFSAPLSASTSYKATIKTGAKDLSGNGLVSDYVWTFTTSAVADIIPPTVLSTNPIDGSINVCSNKSVNATFSKALDPTTVTNATFTLQPSGPPLGANVAGVVSYDTANNVATFVPSALASNTKYTATLTTGIKDLSGNALASNKVITFTTKATTCPTAPPLGAAAPFGAFGGNATVTNDGLATVVNGDLGVNAASTKITGFRDSGGNVYTVTLNNDGKVNGLIYTLTAPPGSVAGAAVTQARLDAKTAFDSISPASIPGGVDVSNLAQCPSCGGIGGGSDELAGRTLPPGVYASATGTYDIGGAGRTTADLVLDAQGDINAVWIFQAAAGTGSLNVGKTGPATPAVPINVKLINGAKPKNVFWYVPAGAVIGTGAHVVGTFLSDAAITISTTGGSPPTAVLTTIDGRALSLTAGVTMTNTVINVPGP